MDKDSIIMCKSQAYNIFSSCQGFRSSSSGSFSGSQRFGSRSNSGFSRSTGGFGSSSGLGSSGFGSSSGSSVSSSGGFSSGGRGSKSYGSNNYGSSNSYSSNSNSGSSYSNRGGGRFRKSFGGDSSSLAQVLATRSSSASYYQNNDDNADKSRSSNEDPSSDAGRESLVPNKLAQAPPQTAKVSFCFTSNVTCDQAWTICDGQLFPKIFTIPIPRSTGPTLAQELHQERPLIASRWQTGNIFGT